MTFDINTIARAIGLTASFPMAEISSLMIDSRSVTEPQSTLFVALRTPNNDGHHYIPALINSGVRHFVVDHIPENVDVSAASFLVVDDTICALRKIGAFARTRLQGTVVGITGSRGKTVVKEWIFQALSASKKVSRSPRSWNSQIGVPLSLWQCLPDADVCLIEAGVSKVGEMAELSRQICPEIGILTAITDEHDDGFASREQKIEEKIELFRHAKAVIYNVDDALIAKAVATHLKGCRLIGIHAGKCDTVEANMLFVNAFLELIGTSNTEKLIARCYPVATRLNVIDGVNNCRLILDRFTSDITSLRVSLDFVRRQVAGRQAITLVLAEEGFEGTDEEVARAVSDYGVQRVIRVSASTVIAERFTTDDFYDEAVLLKGSPAVNLDPLYAILEAKQHETLLEVNLDAVVSNFNFFRSKVLPSTGVVCMLKAHGYGVGSVELARTLQAQGAAYFAVAVVDEGIELRRAGITVPIMVLNPRAQNLRMMFDHRLEPEIYSFDILDEIIAGARRYGVRNFPIHIKLDTGMRRLGFLEADIDRLAEVLADCKEVVAATAFSHLACADDPAQDDYTRGQFALFNHCCDRLNALLPYHVKRHILNSTGIIRFPEMQFDYVRLGIGLYGVATLFDGSMSGLRNVATLTSPIISLKQWKPGDTVGYNRRGTLTRESVIATVPVGYADGIDRHLGYGNLSVLVNGKRCPTVGSICMDICMIDVTDVDCNVGDRVEFFGDNIAPQQLADILSTIPYEILTSISPRVKRVYYRE